MTAPKKHISKAKSNSQSRGSAVNALAAVLEPLTALSLKFGLTCSEFESLARSVYVHQARQMLTTERPPGNKLKASDVQLALATGLHRTIVRKVLGDGPPKIAPAKVGRHNRALKMLNAWAHEWRYLDDFDRPQDLPLYAPKDQPSFEELVRRFAPNSGVRTVLNVLHRAAAIRLLPDDMIRLVSTKLRSPQHNGQRVEEAAARIAAFAEMAISAAMTDGNLPVEETATIPVPLSQALATQDLIARRLRVFLSVLQAEIGNNKNRGEELANIDVFCCTAGPASKTRPAVTDRKLRK